MYIIPYTIQQPHSKHRYEALELQYLLDNDPKIRAILDKKHPHDQNLEERLYECQKEEEIFKEACKENLAYMLEEQDIEPPSEESFHYESEGYSVESYLNEDKFEEEESLDNLILERDSLNKGSMDNFIDGYESENEDNEKYNLRSRKRLKLKKKMSMRKSRASINRTHIGGNAIGGSNRSSNMYSTRRNVRENIGRSISANNINNINQSSRYHTRNRKNVIEVRNYIKLRMILTLMRI